MPETINKIRLIIIILFFLSAFQLCPAQNSPVKTDSLQSNRLKIYITCGNDCDQDYIRTEINYVDYMQQRQDADVNILVIEAETGGGGTEYSMEFIGQDEYANITDTLKYIAPPSESDDNIRAGMVRVLKMGLMRYIARTPLAQNISISYDKPTEKKEIIDNWDNWVFTLSSNLYFQGEKSYKSAQIYSNIQAARVTEASKISLYFYYNYQEYKYSDGDYKATNINRQKGFSGLYVRSLGGHWSAGLRGGVYDSPYGNEEIAVYGGPALEYDIFPYSESTRRMLTIYYRTTVHYVDYESETIYGKMSEWLNSERLTVALSLNRPWGSIYSYISGAHYFHDFSKNTLELYSALSINVVKGLTFNVNSSISLVHDQLGLRKGDLSPEDVILRRNQMETSYQYYASIGISYSFGSKYNNIVNPRMN
jgi:hypothetical protein